MVLRLTVPRPAAPAPVGADVAHRARRRLGADGAELPTRRAGEVGSQTLEFAVLLPAAVLVLLMLVELALAGVDLLGAQVLAREAARAAAMGQDAAAPVDAGANGRRTQVRLEPIDAQPGDAVTATVRIRSRLSDRVGVEVWLPGHATMRREPAP